ncbi:helix-turn-helix transcriptional regulator [Streptomyces hoynatensis]|uniref:helix-turn-helix transcriptional regulator n=1 Tax=Streptomyces hoynatensis TaxID=1141874 RepID=UPI001F4E3BAF|nr:response regulator transcription factor [Streptomyces hoynatensis]
MDLRSADPLSHAGATSQLRARPEILLVETDGGGDPQVVMVIEDTVDEDVLRMLRRIRQSTPARGVLIISHIDEQQLVSAAECGFIGVLRRREATSDRMVRVISAAARGEGYVPPDLLGSLLVQVGRMQGQVLGPRGLNLTGLSVRETEVLKLVAEGYDTADIALKLSYSERTIKNVLHAVMVRLNLRNRSHAVAYALRHGLI